ncbi:AI-2E family transporter [Tepidanaerobacter acetatoxydans]|uniref:AI-2E family transporter n=1 Tax=Tepidanaerobacter acetatoxydans TaxID=499229 RepID=UPI001BD5B8E6|nr:AI-2E family transporter [Tepidanaerobacter acetatoxydans]
MLVFILFILIFVFYNKEKIATIILPFIFGIFITYLLDPLVELLTQKKIDRTVAVVLIYFILIASIVIALVYIIPILLFELNNLIETIPLYTRESQKIIAKIRKNYLASLPISFQEIINRNMDRLQELLLGFLQNAVDAIISIFSNFFSIILGPVLGFYFLKDLPSIKENIILYMSIPYKDTVIEWSEKISKTLGRYIRSQLIVSLIIGFLTTFSMLILGIDFALVIGALAGITNIIPYFGPAIGALPAIIIAILRYPEKIPWIIISMLIIHQLESGIISPHIVGEHVGIYPVTVIFSLLIGGTFFGITGLILAVPVAALIKITLQQNKKD